MKRKFSVLLALILSLYFSITALSGSQAESVKKIRSLYYKTEKNINSYQKQAVHLNEFDIYVAFLKGKEVKKIVLEIPDVWKNNYVYKVKTSYYYHKKRLFFIFINKEMFDPKKRSVAKSRIEERIYINKGRILKALIRETDNKNFNNVPNRNFKKLLNDRALQRDYLGKGRSALRAVLNNI